RSAVLLSHQSRRPASLRLIPLPARPPLFPYTTLFRSEIHGHAHARQHGLVQITDRPIDRIHHQRMIPLAEQRHQGHADGRHARRSEEHTSELQSRENLVCRLLLEKKNIPPTYPPPART